MSCDRTYYSMISPESREARHFLGERLRDLLGLELRSRRARRRDRLDLDLDLVIQSALDSSTGSVPTFAARTEGYCAISGQGVTDSWPSRHCLLFAFDLVVTTKVSHTRDFCG